MRDDLIARLTAQADLADRREDFETRRGMFIAAPNRDLAALLREAAAEIEALRSAYRKARAEVDEALGIKLAEGDHAG